MQPLNSPTNSERPVSDNQRQAIPLSHLAEGESAVIIGFQTPSEGCKERRISVDLTQMRLFELGLMVNETVTVVHKSPFGGHPMAVAVLGSTVGLNFEEAELLVVERVSL